MLDRLDRDERLRLIRFICSFAWADREVQPEERTLVERFADRLGFDEDEMRQVRDWLAVPPEPEALDPGAIPGRHRVVFVEAVESIILADGEITDEERALFQRLMVAE